MSPSHGFARALCGVAAIVAIGLTVQAQTRQGGKPSTQSTKAATAATDSPARFWPQWRGPLGTGEAPSAQPPLEWGEGKNIAWKTEVPGRGKSTPVIWGELIFLTTAVPGTKPAPAGATSVGSSHPAVRAAATPMAFTVMAFSRKDGAVRWQRIVREELPHEGTHQDGTYASGSVLTDGARVYAFFGSRGLYALDMQGKPVWEKDLGRMQTRNAFGEGASPALHGDTLVVNWDHEGSDFVAALDAKTGKERWRQSRDEPTTWATPHVAVHGGKPQVIINGRNRVVSYDLATGEPLWQAPGLTENVIPSPVSGDGFAFAMSGFRGNMARAIDLGQAKGDLAASPALVWSYDRDTPYVPSPLLYRGGLYFLKSNSGVMTQLDAKTGAVRYTQRLEGTPNVYASPVAADGRIYVVGREGSTVVLEAGPQPKVLATNALDESTDASLALVDREIYLRGSKHLYRISSN
jgi:outer membrane protein assembly factor BamB